jgi:hypothetical protein
LAASVSDPTKQYPKFKAATWFEEKKLETDYNTPGLTVSKDYYITYNPLISQGFLADMNALGPAITWANNLNVTCAGHLNYVP